MDFQNIVRKLDRYWARQGCCLLPPGAASAGPLPAACLAGAACRPSSGDGLEGGYRYRVLLRPAPAGARPLFLGALRAAGLDLSEHDLRWNAFDGPQGRGWAVLLDGLPLARFAYSRPSGPRSVSVETGLERLAMTLQKKKAPADILWAGRLTYGELHSGEAA